VKATGCNPSFGSSFSLTGIVGLAVAAAARLFGLMDF
jgi:hypothetical protein